MRLRHLLPEPVRRSLRPLRAAVVAVVRAGAHPAFTTKLLVSPNVRRAEPRSRRRLLAAAVAAAITLVVAVAGVVITHLWWAALLLAPFVVVAGRDAWNGRSRRGERAGLPPGRIRHGPTWVLDPQTFARDAERFGPVFKTNFYDIATTCVVDLPAASLLLRQEADSLGPPWGPYERFVPGGSVRGSTGARNRELRQTYTRALGPDAVRAWSPAFTRYGEECLAALAAECGQERGGTDPRATVDLVTFALWMEVILGLRVTGPERIELCSLVDRLVPDRQYYADRVDDDEVEEGLDRLGAMVIAAARQPDHAVTDSLARRFDGEDHRGLDDPGILRNVIYSLITTRDDIMSLDVWMLWYLAAHPEWAGRIRADGITGEATANFVSEVLRLQQSEFLMRRATAGIDHTGPVGRVVVPDGWYLRVCIREIHRDPAVFTDAETFDPDRFAREDDMPVRRGTYAPFGIDHRACVGELLTRTAAAHFAHAAAGYRLATLSDGPLELARERHWAPSRRWRLLVSPPAPAP